MASRIEDPDTVIKELEILEQQLKQIRIQTKGLQERKLKLNENLVYYMESFGVDSYKNYKLEKLKPKPRAKPKKAKDKRDDCIELLSLYNIPHADELYEEILATQTNRRPVKKGKK